MHGLCDARLMVTFPAAERHRPLASTKLYCLVTEAHGCEQLAYIAARPRIEPSTAWSQVWRPNRYATKTPYYSRSDRIPKVRHCWSNAFYSSAPQIQLSWHCLPYKCLYYYYYYHWPNALPVTHQQHQAVRQQLRLYIFKVFIEYPLNVGSGCISMFSINLTFDNAILLFFLQKSPLFGL